MLLKGYITSMNIKVIYCFSTKHHLVSLRVIGCFVNIEQPIGYMQGKYNYSKNSLYIYICTKKHRLITNANM